MEADWDDLRSVGKTKWLKFFGLGPLYLPAIINDPEELLCMWIKAFSIYALEFKTEKI